MLATVFSGAWWYGGRCGAKKDILFRSERPRKCTAHTTGHPTYGLGLYVVVGREVNRRMRKPLGKIVGRGGSENAGAADKAYGI